MQLIFAAAPQDLQAASGYAAALAHAAYRIGEESSLLRRSTTPAKGGYLLLRDCGAPAILQPETLCAAVMRECGRRSFRGVILDFAEPSQPDRAAFAALLAKRLSQNRQTLFLPEHYALSGAPAMILLCTALSGGDYTQRLRDAVNRFGGPQHLALDVQRLRMDFPLPAPSGTGTPLTAEELQTLTEREQPSVFFSPALCARYFTYMQKEQAHFVLFDDPETMGRKLKIAASLRISTALFMWSEICDIAGTLCRRKQKTPHP